MIEVLASAPQGRTAEALADLPQAEPFRSWVAEAEPRMLDVAARLVKLWGRRE